MFLILLMLVGYYMIKYKHVTVYTVPCYNTVVITMLVCYMYHKTCT